MTAVTPPYQTVWYGTRAEPYQTVWYAADTSPYQTVWYGAGGLRSGVEWLG